MRGSEFMGNPISEWFALQASMLAAGFNSPAELTEFLDNQDASLMQYKAAALEAEAKLVRITKILNLGASPCK